MLKEYISQLSHITLSKARSILGSCSAFPSIAMCSLHVFKVLLLALSFSTINAQQTDQALRCKDHPAYKTTMKPVLISSWDYDIASHEGAQLAYIPRHKGHSYAPIDNLRSTKFKGLDLFHTADTMGPSFRMTFQRSARVYMLVSVEKEQFDPRKFADLRGGWKSEGWAERVSGQDTITYGIHGSLKRKMPKYTFVFSKNTGPKDFIELPQARFVQQRISGISVSGIFNLLIAEADGGASPPVGNFQGKQIAPNTRCPQKLHDMWVAEDDNDADRDTQGVKFFTWHPAWDPCFWWYVYLSISLELVYLCDEKTSNCFLFYTILLLAL